MKWSGLALVSFAALFLVSTAITRGWIGPELQLAAATLIGFSLYGFAWFLQGKRHQWTQALNHAGAIITIACAAAAHEWLNLVSLPAALGLMAGAAAIALAACVRLRTPLAGATAMLSTLGAVLFMNISVELSVGTAALIISMVAVTSTCVALLPATKKLPESTGDEANHDSDEFTGRWRVQRVVSVVAAAIVMLASINQYVFFGSNQDSGTRLVALLAISVMAICLWLGPVSEEWFGRLRHGTPSKGSDSFRYRSTMEYRLLIGLPLWSWLCALPLLLNDFPLSSGGIGLALAAAFGLLAVLSRRSLPANVYVSHLLGVSTLATISIFALLDGPVVVVALAAQAIGCAVLGRRLDDALLRWNGLALAAAASFSISIFVMDFDGLADDWQTVLASLTVAAAGLVVVHVSRTKLHPGAREGASTLAWVLVVLTAWIVGSYYLDGIEQLLILTVMAAASAAAQPLLGRGVGLLGAGLGGLAILGASNTFLLALVDGASLLGHVANLSVAVLIIAVAVFLTSRKHNLAAASIGAAWITSMVWLATALVYLPQGQLLLSAAWAFAAAMAVLTGVVKADRTFQILGMSTLAVVLIKLFSVDLGTIDTFWRAGLFFVVGVGFLQLGYRLPQVSNRRASNVNTETAPDPANQPSKG